ncbi:looped-hinge helix DNA binding domain, AbrB family [Desulfocurvibacter africanus PCS]|uniref:Looped-hinge helix DNA binding domain, AbrB family n=1 Tax=Desulfocurvibacter africanus PCS TaxID=1262666 RepID=M5Q040_DESAF|nr:AbrB/MazE/SpoVT family DNA-binding domain-containing protein [Desulfocurvibacter africanus]EMG36376.1 looped-hinge helix DNA binding domain, AbrB family [Desulfocurvibacter africanus PCS]
MEAATVSSKYQIVIPRSVRKAMDIRPGQEIQVIIHEGRIELLPVRDV